MADRILILIPHPDDEVVGCCAAIGRARARGAHVSGFYLTTGVPAREVLWPWQRRAYDERIARRRTEAATAAELLGIEPVAWQEIPTRTLKDQIPQTCIRLSTHLSEGGFGMLWTPSYEGGHQDHDVANFIASLFQERIPVWEFSEYNFSGGRVRLNTCIHQTGTEHTLMLEGSEKSFKRRLLAVYRSERRNLRYAGTEKECFRPLRAVDYTRPPHEGRLFYQRFQWVPFHHPQIDRCTPMEVSRRMAAIQDQTRAGA